METNRESKSDGNGTSNGTNTYGGNKHIVGWSSFFGGLVQWAVTVNLSNNSLLLGGFHLRSLLSLCRDRPIALLVRGVHSDLDCNGPALKFLTLESIHRLLLRLFVTNIDKAVALASPWVTPATTDNPSRCNRAPGLSENGCQTVIVERERQVRNEKC